MKYPSFLESKNGLIFWQLDYYTYSVEDAATKEEWWGCIGFPYEDAKEQFDLLCKHADDLRKKKPG